jgi:hypothetical protein
MVVIDADGPLLGACPGTVRTFIRIISIAALVHLCEILVGVSIAIVVHEIAGFCKSLLGIAGCESVIGANTLAYARAQSIGGRAAGAGPCSGGGCEAFALPFHGTAKGQLLIVHNHALTAGARQTVGV